MGLDPYTWARPLLFSLDAERAHRLTLGLARCASAMAPARSLAHALYAPPADPRLETHAFGLQFPTPLGLAAGLDKDGAAIDLWAALGFGFVELGTVTPGEGQPGNEPPRLVRLRGDQAIVNRMGFNNRGAPRLARRLEARRTSIPCGANLGKAKLTPLEAAPDDYEAGLRAVWPSADYVVVNVSSPNTPGLRDLQAVSALEPLLTRVLSVNRALAAEAEATGSAPRSGIRPRPVLLKIAPDLADEDVDAVAELALGLGLDGIVASNTTLRHELAHERSSIQGGLSGPPLGPRALALVRRLYRRLEGRVALVGVGGIGSAEDAYRRLRAGANLLQLYTALVYQGPAVVGRILRGLAEILEREGYDRVEAVVGLDA
jgi:dihydroorotate dehydrogenase